MRIYEENASLLMLKLITTSDNCFRKALAQDLFMQGSTSSLHFPISVIGHGSSISCAGFDILCAYYTTMVSAI